MAPRMAHPFSGCPALKDETTSQLVCPAFEHRERHSAPQQRRVDVAVEPTLDGYGDAHNPKTSTQNPRRQK